MDSDEPIPRDLGDDEALRREEPFVKFVKGYNGPDAIVVKDLTASEIEKHCEVITTGVFRLIGLKPAEHTACFTASVKKCIKTHVLETTIWSKWGGYHHFALRMRALARMTMETNKLHILNAPALIAAIAVRYMKNVQVATKQDIITPILENCKAFEYAHFAVKAWTNGSKKAIISTDKPYDGPLLEVGASAEGDNVLIDEDETLDLEENDETMTFDKNDYTRNLAQMMYEIQQLGVPGARLRTPSPPPTIMVSTQVTETREDVMEKVGGLINGMWNEETNAKLKKMLTGNMVQVLPHDMKIVLTSWARQTMHPDLPRWLREATEDKTTYEWTKHEKKPSVPLCRSNPADQVLDNMLQLAESDNMKDEVKEELITMVNQLLHYNTYMEVKYKQWAKIEALKECAVERRQENDRLAEMQRQENDRLAEVQRQENDRLAEVQRQENDRVAEMQRQENDRLAEVQRQENDRYTKAFTEAHREAMKWLAKEQRMANKKLLIANKKILEDVKASVENIGKRAMEETEKLEGQRQTKRLATAATESST